MHLLIPAFYILLYIPTEYFSRHTTDKFYEKADFYCGREHQKKS